MIADRARHQSDVASLREPAFRVIARMDDVEPHVQFNALMLAAAVACRALGLDAHDELSRAIRKIAPAQAPHTAHVQALEDFFRNELARS